MRASWAYIRGGRVKGECICRIMGSHDEGKGEGIWSIMGSHYNDVGSQLAVVQ